MNAKLEKHENRWFVVVNSVAGEVRLDVTDRVSKEIQSEVDARIQSGALAILGEQKAKRLEVLEAAFDEIESAVRSAATS